MSPREKSAGSGPQTDAERIIRDAALAPWLSMGADDPAGTLRHLDAGRRYLDRAIGREVIRLRKAGHTWGDIGTALSITRSAAQQRYAEVNPRKRARRRDS